MEDNDTEDTDVNIYLDDDEDEDDDDEEEATFTESDDDNDDMIEDEARFLKLPNAKNSMSVIRNLGRTFRSAKKRNEQENLAKTVNIIAAILQESNAEITRRLENNECTIIEEQSYVKVPLSQKNQKQLSEMINAASDLWWTQVTDEIYESARMELLWSGGCLFIHVVTDDD